jgi:hypothetical protein
MGAMRSGAIVFGLALIDGSDFPAYGFIDFAQRDETTHRDESVSS